MSSILIKNGKTKQLKNLGWLLNNWKKIKEMGFTYHPNNVINGELWAKLNDNSTYITDFVSLSVCWNWLNRPVFKGNSFTLSFGKDLNERKNFTIGNEIWKRINKLEYQLFLSYLFNIELKIKCERCLNTFNSSFRLNFFNFKPNQINFEHCPHCQMITSLVILNPSLNHKI